MRPTAITYSLFVLTVSFLLELVLCQHLQSNYNDKRYTLHLLDAYTAVFPSIYTYYRHLIDTSISSEAEQAVTPTVQDQGTAVLLWQKFANTYKEKFNSTVTREVSSSSLPMEKSIDAALGRFTGLGVAVVGLAAFLL